MVSPMAREIPRTTAATMPDSAAGNTTFSVVCIRFAPRAADPCRMPSGTADSASSDSEAMGAPPAVLDDAAVQVFSRRIGR